MKYDDVITILRWRTDAILTNVLSAQNWKGIIRCRHISRDHVLIKSYLLTYLLLNFLHISMLYWLAIGLCVDVKHYTSHCITVINTSTCREGKYHSYRGGVRGFGDRYRDAVTNSTDSWSM